MRTVVVGGYGFLGSAAVRALAAAGHEAIALGRDARPVAGCDVLVWAAGRRFPDLETNHAVHVAAAVEALRVHRPARVVYLSTGECYGDAPVPFVEDGALRGTSPYALAKLEAEQAVAREAETLGGVAIALRLGVVYGPGQAPRMLIPQVVTALVRGEHIALTAGQQTRDFVYVDDVADAIVRACTAPPAPAVINIGTGTETAVRDVCRQLAEIAGAREQLLGFGELPMRPDEPGRYALSVERAAQLLDWRATTPLAAGLAAIVREARGT